MEVQYSAPHLNSWSDHCFFSLAGMTLSAGSVSLQTKQTDCWVNSSSICISQTFAFVLRKKAAQTCISANCSHTTVLIQLSWSQASVVSRFWLTGKCLIWSLNFYFWLTSIWNLWSFFPWSGKMNSQGQVCLGYSPVCFTKTVFNVLSHNLFLMSSLTEHCGTVIIQGLLSTAIFEHQLHIFLFPG